jgi:penicillin-binding protein 1A
MTDPTGALQYVRPDPAPAPETPTPAAPPPKRPFWRRRPWQLAGGALLLLMAVAVFVGWSLPLGQALEPLQSPTIVLVTADGKPFSRRGSYKEAPVDVAKLPAHVPQAFISIEDRRFYKHLGIDPRAIARAMRANVEAGGVSEGASTITQQLAKNAFLSNDRTLRRKVQEVLIAFYLEARLSKDEILSRYLSAVYFGDGVFGLRAAARHYFDKTPEQLSIGEAAMLAGMVKAPSRLAPTENLPAARERMRVVLGAMVDTGAITRAQARRAARNVNVRQGREKLPVGSYFADWISADAKKIFERAYGEVVVRTTLDSALQAQAERIVRRTLDGNRWANANQAALVAMRTDGSVVAMVGGRDYAESQFNRTDAGRQPGSAFKLFVYWAAMRAGMTPSTLVDDTRLTIADWSPENHENKYANRPIPLRSAFAGSSNVAAARLAQEMGRGPIERAARELGVTAKLPTDLTLSLGTGPMSLVELTAAYAGIAAGQAPVKAYGIQGLRPDVARHALPGRELKDMRELLKAAVTFGTGMPANMAGAYGKTGTTQDYRDALFVGFVGDLVVGVWVGNDDNSPMRGVVGGGMPARIWREFMQYAESRRHPQPAPAPVAEEAPEELAPADLEGLAPVVPPEGEAPADAAAPPTDAAPPAEAEAPSQPLF